MKRRELFTTMVATGIGVPVLGAQGEHNHKPISGPHANATVSFGSWPLAPADGRPNAGNRFVLPSAGPGGQANGHALLPHEATIKAGGTVNFIVAGFHLITVYAPGKDPADVNVTSLISGSVPGLIDDPDGRVYFGLDPRTVPQDRVEVVQFSGRGRYLVICGVRPHFVSDQMYGWVTVLP